MATCTVTYSPELARRATRTYFWRRFKTPLGVFYLASYPLAIGGIWFFYSLNGADWVVGAIGFLLCMNFMIQITNFFALPRVFARKFADPANRTAEVETSAEGVRIVLGRTGTILKWTVYKNVWIYKGFVILSINPLMAQCAHIPTDGMSLEVLRDLERASQRSGGT